MHMGLSLGGGLARMAARAWRVLPAYGLIVALVNAAPAAAAEPVRILALGDSLTAGLGLPRQQAFPARLQQALAARGLAVRVIDAGVSGDTSAAGLARLDWVLAERPDLAIVELGANDGLRGLDPADTYANLDRILARLEQDGVRVVLAGMLAPPNLGRDYGEEFAAVYRRLAEKHRVVFYPFFLDGVAGEAALNLPDGMHPNAQGVEVIVGRLAPLVARLIEQPA